MPDAATITAIGIGVGSTLGASLGALITTLRTNKQTSDIRKDTVALQKQASEIRTELDGPDDQPSLRQMVKDGNIASLDQYTRLHTDMVRMGDRLKQVEDGHGSTIIATMLSSLHSNMQDLSRSLRRCRYNIHHVAQAAQVNLFTEEEVDAKMKEEEGLEPPK